MAINYETMKSSENELLTEFEKFFKHVYDTWKYFLKHLKSDSVEEDVLTKVYELEELSNFYEAQIRDDCIWTISKNQPLGSHLRFIIAILESSASLERMADHAMYATRYFAMNKKVNKDIVKLIVDVLEESIDAVKKIFESVVGKLPKEISHVTSKVQIDYRKKYNEALEELAKIYKTMSAAEIADVLTGAAIVLKQAERNVDHAINISENFIYIRQSDFFFHKKSKQAPKAKVDNTKEKIKEVIKTETGTSKIKVKTKNKKSRIKVKVKA